MINLSGKSRRYINTLIAEQATEISRLRRDCAEAYQVVGVLAEHYGAFDTDDVTRALDNLSDAGNGRPRRHDDLLPWPREPLPGGSK